MTDADAVAVAGKDDSGVPRAFTMRDLHDVRRQVVGVAAELRDTGFNRVPRPCGFVEKDHEKGLVLQQTVGLA
jgi:hypothetical protein